MTCTFFHAICRMGCCNESCPKDCNFPRPLYMQLDYLLVMQASLKRKILLVSFTEF